MAENNVNDPTAAGYWVLLDPNQFPGVEAEALYVSGNVILMQDGSSPSTVYIYDKTTETFTAVSGSSLTTDHYSVDPNTGAVTTKANAIAGIPAGSFVYLTEDLSDPFYAGIALLDSSGNVILSGGQIRTANAHTLQSLIEVNYVREGNRLMESALSGLDKALSATDRAIRVLAEVQNLHNSLLVEALDPLQFEYWVKWGGGYNTPSDYIWQQVFHIIGVMDPGDRPRQFTQLIDRYTKAYNAYASAYFGLPIFPDFMYTSYRAEGFQEEFLPQFQNMRTELSNTLSALDLVPGQDPNDTTTLAGKLQRVLNDMPADGQIATSDPQQAYLNLKSWAMDYYRAYEGGSYMSDSAEGADGEVFTRMVAKTAVTLAFTAAGSSVGGVPQSQIIIYLKDMTGVIDELSPQSVANFYNSNYLRDASKAGSIQDNITFAITAAQSLNDSQKEQVRRYMYVFEEYYKSASSLLAAISQLIQKIAQGIRPS
jgi:hypothetical protein